MEYTKEIISLISWPILIYLTYRLSLVALKFFDKNFKGENAEN